MQMLSTSPVPEELTGFLTGAGGSTTRLPEEPAVPGNIEVFKRLKEQIAFR